jgi:hypothetical protein
MKTSDLLSSPSLMDRMQRATAASPVLRGALWSALAVGVTVGGVLAGALVVAPVVTKASQPAVTAQWSRTATLLGSSAIGFAREAGRLIASQTRELSSAVASRSPDAIGPFVLPLLVLLSVGAGMSLVAARRRAHSRTATLSLVPVSAVAMPKPRAAARSRDSRGRDSRTPKAVEALAASGASTSDIARRTGLPLDAVQLLLSISSGSRQVQPPSA